MYFSNGKIKNNIILILTKFALLDIPKCRYDTFYILFIGMWGNVGYVDFVETPKNTNKYEIRYTYQGKQV